MLIATLYDCRVVPFEEDERDPNIWFLDHSYLEGMSAMFKKVNGRQTASLYVGSVKQQSQSGLTSKLCLCAAKERILGFYSTGPRLREADLDISDLLSSYAEPPLLLICQVQVRLLHKLIASVSMVLTFVRHHLPSSCGAAAKGDGFANNRLLPQGADSRGQLNFRGLFYAFVHWPSSNS